MHQLKLACLALFPAAVVSSCIIHETVRSQIVSRLYGNQRISWRDFRNVVDWFGRDGMWNLHHQYYPASRLRFWFAVSFSAAILAFILGSFLQAHGIR